MDDDIRNRFRSFSDDRQPRRPAPSYNSRPLTPQEPSQPPAPQPQPFMSSQPAQPQPPKPIFVPKPVIAPPRPSMPSQPNEKQQPKAAPFAPPSKTKKPKRSKKRFILPLAVLLLLSSAGAGAFLYLKKSTPKASLATGSQSTEKQAETPTGTIRLIATGEMMAHDSVNQNAKKSDGSYDYSPYFDNLKGYFSKADVRVCTQGTPSGGIALGVAGNPTFNAPLEFARGIESAGCNVINLATAHMNDKSQEGINGTLSAWKSRAGVLATAGANTNTDEQKQVRYFTVRGVKFAFLAYTTQSQNKTIAPGSLNMYSDDLALPQVKEAHKEANFVIVSMYWGNDGSADLTADQEAVAQKLATAGADAVIGTGSHVLQTSKVLNGEGGHQTLVWYGLGNSLNTQLPAENLVGGIAVMDIDAATRKITNPALLPTFMGYEWSAAEAKAQTLTARKNLKLYALDQAGDAITKTQLKTDVNAQTQRVTALMTKFIPIKVIKSSDY